MSKLTEEGERKYREALEIWLKENPDKGINDIKKNDTIIISTGEKVLIGSRVYNIKCAIKGIGTCKLTPDQYDYWVVKKGLSIENKRYMASEEEYREALEIWLKENPGKNINDVKKGTIVKISTGAKINLTAKIGNLKSILRGIVNNAKLTADQYDYWVVEKGLSVEYKKYIPSEKDFREALEIWLKENPGKNINDVKAITIVKISSGEEINLGSKIRTMKGVIKDKRKLTPEQYEYWIVEKGLLVGNKKYIPSEKDFREALEIWLKENPEKNINDVKATATVKISSGEEINLGSRINNIKANVRGTKSGGLTDDQYNFWFVEKGLDVQILNPEYAEYFGLDKEKVERISNTLKNINEKKKTNKKNEYSLDEILKMFDVDLDTLNKELERIRIRNKEQNDDQLLYQDGTLRSYCIKNGYNYDVIYRAIKLHQFCEHDSLEQLINRAISDYNKKGQKEPSTWIYEKYGRLVKHILLYLRLDSTAILENMSSNIVSLEKAIRHDVFRLNVSNKQNAWLEELYDFLVEEIDEKKSQSQITTDVSQMFKILVETYKLDQGETNELWSLFGKYVNTMLKYKKADVGLETNDERRLKKIQEYNFDEYDIEDCFFVPLEFNKNVLIGRESELYKRRQLLRQYIIDWNTYTDNEKERIIENNYFSKEEIEIIQSTRSKIDESLKISSKGKVA